MNFVVPCEACRDAGEPPCGHFATDSEILSAVLNLEGVEVVESRYDATIFDEITGSYRNVKPGRYVIIPLEEPADG